jgi:hypothetical protein
LKTKPRARAIRRALLAAIVGILVLGAVSEAGVRFLLFHESGLARRLGAGLRRADLYADPLSEDAYWKLRYLLEEGARRGETLLDPCPSWRRPVRELELSAEHEAGSSESSWIHLAGAVLE